MKKSILVVDDDVINIKTAQRFLEEEYDVATAISGKMMFKILEKFHPDLILLDINMPGEDGFQVMEKIQASSEFKKIPVIFLTAEISPDIETKALESGAVDYITKPFNHLVLKNRISRSIQMIQYQNKLEEMVELQAKEIYAQLERLTSMQHKVIISMADLIECRDGSTGEHVKRTSAFVEAIALEFQKRTADKLDPEYIDALIKSAVLHDIGKIKVSDVILQKPGRLTPEEFELMKLHTIEGGKIINNLLSTIGEKDSMEIAYHIAMHHHEKWDGTGYPTGLAGENIPLAARIMAIADVFDALISKRCYKKEMTFDQAFNIIEEGSGVHFDPVLSQCFLSQRKQIEEIAIRIADVVE